MADEASGDAIQDEQQAGGSNPGPEGMIYAVADVAASAPTPDPAGAAHAATAASPSTDQGLPSAAAATPPSRDDSDIEDATSRDKDVAGASGGAAAQGSAEGKSGCPVHGGDDFVAYCTTCSCLVCVDCIMGTNAPHGGHDAIRIRNLLQNPEVFSETLTKLSSLLQDKQQYAKTLEQIAKDVDAGHCAQLQVIREAEKTAIAKLHKTYNTEAAKLKADCDRQEAKIKKVAEQAVKKVEEHGKKQRSRIRSEHKKVKASIPAVSVIAATLDVTPARDTLPSIVKANEDGKSVLLKEETFQPIRDVESTANDVDATGVQDFTDLTVYVAPLPGTIAGLRNQIRKLVLADISSYSASNAGSDPALMDRSYHVACHNFAAGKTNIFPGPFREPDVTRPFSAGHDVTFIPASDAAALTSVVGGKRVLKQKKKPNSCYYLEDAQGTMVCCYAVLFDDKRNRHTSKSGKPGSAWCFLPVEMKMGEALEGYLGWRPSSVKELQTGKVVTMGMKVKQWRESFDYCRLTVLK